MARYAMASALARALPVALALAALALASTAELGGMRPVPAAVFMGPTTRGISKPRAIGAALGPAWLALVAVISVFAVGWYLGGRWPPQVGLADATCAPGGCHLAGANCGPPSPSAVMESLLTADDGSDRGSASVELSGLGGGGQAAGAPMPWCPRLEDCAAALDVDDTRWRDDDGCVMRNALTAASTNRDHVPRAGNPVPMPLGGARGGDGAAAGALILAAPVVRREVPPQQPAPAAAPAPDPERLFRSFRDRFVGDFGIRDIHTTSRIPGASYGLKTVMPRLVFAAEPDGQNGSAKLRVDFGLTWMSRKVAKPFAHRDLVPILDGGVTVSVSQMRFGEGAQVIDLGTEQILLYRRFMRKDDDLNSWVDPLDIYVYQDLACFYNKCIPWKAKGQTVGDVNMGIYVRYGAACSKDAIGNLQRRIAAVRPGASAAKRAGEVISDAAALDELSKITTQFCK